MGFDRTMIAKQITIIGAGMIGSSLARAIKANDLCETLVISDASSAVCDTVRTLNLCDQVMPDVTKCAMGSDVIILATPVGAYENIAAKICPALKPGAIITDVGSVKGAVIDAIAPHLPDSCHLVPAHPIAGGEKSGPEHGIGHLFQDRWCILTPSDNTDLQAVETIAKLWEGMGAIIEYMGAQRHDLVLGITSHLPHLIAYTIVDTAEQLEDDLKSEVIKYSAGGFRDFTRIAASDPTMWRDVFLHNKDAVLEILQRFTEDLTALQKSIRRGDGTYLHDTFSRTRDIRKKVIGLGEKGKPVPEEG